MLNLSFFDIFRYFMSLTPLFITCFLVLVSILNQNAKGLVYIGGLLMVAVFTLGLKQLFRSVGRQRPADYLAETCQVFNLPAIATDVSTPDFNSMFLSFTTMYLAMPMALQATPVNAILLVMMGIFIIGNGITRISQKCNWPLDIVVGNLIGGSLGVAYFYIFWATNNKNLLFIDDLSSNNVTCSRPSKQTFKCAVYKNGQIIKNL